MQVWSIYLNNSNLHFSLLRLNYFHIKSGYLLVKYCEKVYDL